MRSEAHVRKLGFDPERLERIQTWMERYVDAGKLPFAATLISRHGEPVWQGHTGQRDVEAGTAYEPDTIARIYSMTKPVTAVGLMMLHEQALFHLDDPIAEFLPEFADLQVLRKGARKLDDVEALSVKPTIHNLFTHTAGLTYGFQGGMLGEAYAKADVDFNPDGAGLAATTKKLAGMPLLFQPGGEWNYSVATDVLGRLIEVISGRPLDQYLSENIFAPLGMTDTGFEVPDDKIDRLASCYVPDEQNGMALNENSQDSKYRAGKVKTFSGGGGLLSTGGDYQRLAEMLRRGGNAGNERLLSPRTIEFMASNHLESDLASMGPATWCETSFSGVGFGLGVSVILNPAKAQLAASVGDYGWGGMASTVFWIDPVEDMSVVYLTQLIPSDTYALRKELRTLVYQALVD